MATTIMYAGLYQRVSISHIFLLLLSSYKKLTNNHYTVIFCRDD